MSLREQISPQPLGIHAAAALAVVIAAQLRLLPGVDAAYGGLGWLAHPYRLSMAVAVLALAVSVGLVSALAARRAPWSVGLGLLIVMGMITGTILTFAPWILYPEDRYPVTFLWLLLGAPAGFVVWLVASNWIRRDGEPVEN